MRLNKANLAPLLASEITVLINSLVSQIDADGDLVSS